MAKFPSMSPYCAFDNNPIYYIDPYGLEGQEPIDRTGNDQNSDGEKAYRAKTIQDHIANGGDEGEITFIYKDVPTTGGKTGTLTFRYDRVTGSQTQRIQEHWNLTNQRAGISNGVSNKFDVQESQVAQSSEGLSDPENDNKTQSGTTEVKTNNSSLNKKTEVTNTNKENGGSGKDDSHSHTKTEIEPPIARSYARFALRDDYFEKSQRQRAYQSLKEVSDYLMSNPYQKYALHIFVNTDGSGKAGDLVGGDKGKWFPSDKSITQYSKRPLSSLAYGRYQTVIKIVRNQSGMSDFTPSYNPHYNGTEMKFELKPIK
jgi:hypothetical protein